MPRIKTTLDSSNEKKVKSFFSKLEKKSSIYDEKFQSDYMVLLKKELKNLRDLSQKDVVNSIILFSDQYLDGTNTDIQSVWESIVTSSRERLAASFNQLEFDNLIDIYFNEVKQEYILHPMDESNDLEFLPENRDIFIKNNLKLVVACAKRYRDMGLPFEDLIQCGNDGLMKAFYKFDTSRAKLRNSIIKDIENFPSDTFTYDEATNIITTNYTYTDSSNKKAITAVPKNGFSSKEEFISWAKKNVKTAVFASVAFQWIRAGITQGLDEACVIKMPQKERKTIIYLDSANPYTDDTYNDDDLSDVTQEAFAEEDESILKNERDELYKEVVGQCLIGLSPTDKRIIKKKFGIGFPYSLSNPEIAESERISLSDVKDAIDRALEHIRNNIDDDCRDMILEMMS